MTRSGNTYYYMMDGLGSVRNVVESDEDVANVYDYYAFGNTLGGPTTGITNPYEYTAREFEDGSLNTTFYYRNRYYMSALGIFASRDAAFANVHRGWGCVRNMPTMFADPLGLGPGGYEGPYPLGPECPWNDWPPEGGTSGPPGGEGTWQGYVDPMENGKEGASADCGFRPPSKEFCDRVEFIQISKLHDDRILTFDDEHDWRIDSPTGDFWYTTLGAAPNSFHDSPKLGPTTFGHRQGSGGDFEVCAICADGEDKGKIYSCIPWGYSKGANGIQTYGSPGLFSSGYQPSYIFLELWKAWQYAHGGLIDLTMVGGPVMPGPAF